MNDSQLDALEACEDYDVDKIVNELIRQGICDKEDILMRLSDYIEELDWDELDD